ncbi:hypothetical protein APED_23220 [Acanthopleuribacter pedis]
MPKNLRLIIFFHLQRPPTVEGSRQSPLQSETSLLLQHQIS